jgi:alginate O-acetyltransferase complex protein AlgI
MLFNSFEFLVFFPVVAALYFACPHRFRWVLLLAASYVFYMWWRVEYILLIVASTALDYTAALRIQHAETERTRKQWLCVSLAGNLGLLFFFKYFNFFNDSIRATFEALDMEYAIPAATVLLPVGISFYTFQTLSYTIEVYLGNKTAERHIGKFALYVAFFPQLVAGPIERATSLLPQFFERKTFEYERVTDGMKLMVWGFFKKLVIADRLATMVDPVYGDLANHSGPAIAIATVFFAYQIYCDFSGYSDIAIGAAQVLGFKLMMNFRQPYFSRSIPEFWRRWHISLSTWFRDYVYIPLGGNRVARTRLVRATLPSSLSSAASGTAPTGRSSPGAACTAIYMVTSLSPPAWRARFTAAARLDRVPIVHGALQWATTFALVCFAWIFSGPRSIDDAFAAIGLLTVRDGHNAVPRLDNGNILLGNARFDGGEFFTALAALALLEFVHVLQLPRQCARTLINRQWLPVRWFIYSVSLWLIFLFGMFNEQEFIYFVF